MFSNEQIADKVHAIGEEMSGVQSVVQDFADKIEVLKDWADDNSEDDSSFFAVVEDLFSKVQQIASDVELAVTAAEEVAA